MLKVYVEAERYVLDVLLQSDEPDAAARFAEVRETIAARLLPAIEASGVIETDAVE